MSFSLAVLMSSAQVWTNPGYVRSLTLPNLDIPTLPQKHNNSTSSDPRPVEREPIQPIRALENDIGFHVSV